MTGESRGPRDPRDDPPDAPRAQESPETRVLEVGPLDHVGIAVRDLDAALARYRRLLGAEPGHRETVPAQGVEVAFLRLPGETRLELVAPVSGEGPVARFLERRGEGLHHVCVRVTDIEEALERLAAAGEALVDRRPRAGAGGSRIAFVHPEALGGVLLELKEVAAGRSRSRRR